MALHWEVAMPYCIIQKNMELLPCKIIPITNIHKIIITNFAIDIGRTAYIAHHPLVSKKFITIMKYLLTFLTAVLMILSANATTDNRTVAPAIRVMPTLGITMYVQRYQVNLIPREGTIYYRWKDDIEGIWSEWSECGRVIIFDKPATYTVEAFSKKAGKLESAHLTTTFTVTYAGMSVAPGLSLQPEAKRGYYLSFTSLFEYDIYYRWKMGDDNMSKWYLYQEPIPFTEVGRYTVEAQCDYDYVSLSFEVDNSTIGGEEFSLGDVNMDGDINIADVTSLISYILGNPPEVFDKQLADVNGDGVVNVTDVTNLIDLLAKQ